jgi:hypothetical protein
MPSISIEELTPEQRKNLQVKMPRQHSFTKEDVHSWAFRILAAMHKLNQEQRRRVLQHALKVNRLSVREHK